MDIYKAKRAGFCFGVKRAVDIAFEQAKKYSDVHTLGPIIHNPQLVKRLEDMGVRPFEETQVNKIKAEHTIIIRTHGIPVNTLNALKNTGCRIIDATCPFVKKAQNYTKILNENGYQVLIIGDKDHPEVKGLVSYAGNDAIVVNDTENITATKKRIGIVVQTTQPADLLKKVVIKTLDRAKELVIYNTICNSTDLRLKETIKMAKKVDAMFVVGGKNSANTTQLTKLCLSKKIPTFHIETASEIEDSWFKGIKRIGITAGASTPEWIIDEVIQSIKDRGGKA